MLPHTLKLYDQYYDDSSDEDEVEKKISSYQIKTSWEKKVDQSENTSKTNSLQNDEMLSFVAHVAGIKLLYSTQVNKEYYPLKSKYLSSNTKATHSLHTTIIKIIMQACTQTMNSASSFISLCKRADLAKSFEVQKEKIQETFAKNLEKTVTNNLSALIEWIKTIKYSQKISYTSPVQLFIDDCYTQLHAASQEHFSLPDSKEDRSTIKSDLLKLTKAQIETIATKLQLKKKENLTGKNAAISALNKYKTSYVLLKEEMKKAISASAARGSAHHNLLKKFDEKTYQDTFLKAFITDIMTTKKSEQRKEPIRSALTLLKQYLTVNKQSMAEQMQFEFLHTIEKLLQPTVQRLQRTTLERIHTFISNNPFQFYANLRLSNRSQKRVIANNQTAFFKQDCVARLWRMSKTSLNDVLETQEILSSFGRKDMIECLGNYEKVYDAIQQIQEHLTVTDKQIAEWLRAIFLGKSFDQTHLSSSILHKLHSIVYLLFGCEATRNPAVHVINQMFLDLIIEENGWNFSEGFTNTTKRLPMVPEGAVAVARALESSYRDYMPYRYFYRGVEEKNNKEFTKENLIALEARIVRDWLRTKSPQLAKSRRSDLISLVLETIEEHIPNWCGESIDARHHR